MKIGQYILSLGFIICIVSLFWGIIYRGEVETLYLEKRKAQILPELTTNIDSLSIQVEQYVNDQLLFRNTLIRLKSLISVIVFSTSPFPKKVQVGKDEWLYLKAENSLNNYRSDTLYTEKELQLLTRILNQKKNWLGLKGIKFYLLIPPSKPEIYPEFLPEKWKRETENPGIYNQVYRYLQENTELNLVFPKDKLLEYKKEKQLYYKFDSHWNSNGARIAYSELINKIRNDFPELKPALKSNEISYSTGIKDDYDLLKMINIPGFFSEEFDIPTTMRYPQATKLSIPDYIGLSIFPGEYYENKSASDVHMLMYRDSYGVDLIPYLNCHFRKSSYVWSPLILWQTIYHEKPDIVVLEVTQRRMNDLFILNDSVITNQVIPEEL